MAQKGESGSLVKASGKTTNAIPGPGKNTTGDRRQVQLQDPSSWKPTGSSLHGSAESFTTEAAPSVFHVFTPLHPFPQLDLKLLEGKDQGN